MDKIFHEAIDTFSELLQQASAAGDPEPTAMTLASVARNRQPSARTVLLKQHDARGFVFYTNYTSRKGQQIRQNAKVALLFFWKTLREGVQVKIEGTAEPVSDAEADAYFATRPRMSQIGAWASLQSQTLPDRETFETRIEEVESRFAGQDVTRPPHWSGFRVVPELIEFWYGANYRLHERHRYEKTNGVWHKRMLYP